MKEITWDTCLDNLQCEAYNTRENRRYLSEFEKGIYFARTGKSIDYIDETESYCTGTKECEVCDCGGDRSKCTFYDYVRKEATEINRSKLEEMELEFYRDYIIRHDLLWDAAAEYEEWKRKKHVKNWINKYDHNSYNYKFR